MLFVDGVGVGPADPDVNPLATADLPNLVSLCGGRRPVASPGLESGPSLYPLDANLGVDGLPQSGTGQTTLLTGRNAAKLTGRHFGPYPDARQRELLLEQSLWRRLSDAGLPTALANAYPDRYHERVERGTARMGAVARSAHEAGVELRGPSHLRVGRAVSAFLTNQAWVERLGYADMPLRTEHEAGRALARLARGFSFTMHEYYATDIAGHRGTLADGKRVLEAYDRFLGGIVSEWAASDVLVLVSDHGNVEDLGTKRHTRNPALCAWRGPTPRRLQSLVDVAPSVMAALGL